ncbi:MAG: DegV family protein [Firmicutes bacterium]|nr:DegV family protein [Bacillota bacterium]
MAHKVQISTDSVSDLGDELMAKHGIKVFPLMINLGDESLPDGDGMPQKIFDYYEKTGKLPKTAARSVEDYKEFFASVKPADGELVHFCISTKISASYEMAAGAANEMEGVYVVDTASLSTGSGLSVLYACDLVETGIYTAKEIYQKCQERVKHVQASFVLDSVKFLHKGGRCSGLSAFFASVLSIKPMIRLKDGEMGSGKKYMTKFTKAVDKYVNDILDTFNTPDLKRIFITYTTLPAGMVEHITQMILARYPFESVIPTVAGGTITSHCGKNTVGILYFNDGAGTSNG